MFSYLQTGVHSLLKECDIVFIGEWPPKPRTPVAGHQYCHFNNLGITLNIAKANSITNGLLSLLCPLKAIHIIYNKDISETNRPILTELCHPDRR